MNRWLAWAGMAVIFLSGSACSRAGTAAASSAPLETAQLDGAGILQRTCTVCHDLGGLGAYAGSWGEPEWRSMIETMITYGARLSGPEVDTLARYLGVNYGTEAR